MKKIAFLMFGIADCRHDLLLILLNADNTTPSDLHPSLNFIGGTGYTSPMLPLTCRHTF